MLAHEVFHCYQYEVAGIEETYTGPSWLIEGSARWVDQALVGGSEGYGDDWTEYLTEDSALKKRSYDAIGFYGHLDRFVDMWSEILGLVEEPDTAFARAVALGGTEFLDTWPTGLARLPELGEGWDTSGPGIPALSRTFEEWTLTNANPVVIDAPPGSQQLVEIKISKVELVEVTVDGYGGMYVKGPDEGSRWFSGFHHGYYCAEGSCTCPDGDPLITLRSRTVGALLGLTGTTEASIATFAATDLATACAEAEALKPIEQPCINCATSSGDPHVRTFDGVFYDPMFAGEFVAVRSTNDDLEVQVRQEPFGDTSSVSLDTAVAMRVAGDRIGIYARRDEPLLVNGEPPMSASAVELSGGGRIVIADASYAVVWPDGTTVQVGVSQLYVDLTVVLAPERAAQVEGLFGDFDGNPRDDLILSSGEAVDWTRLADDPIGFRDVFADAWRITTEASLFDYLPGESSETFTDRSFPSVSWLENLSEADRGRGEQVCRAAGVVESEFLEDCVLDVAVTGDADFALSAAANVPPVGHRVLATTASVGDVVTFRADVGPDGLPVVAALTLLEDRSHLMLIRCDDSRCDSTRTLAIDDDVSFAPFAMTAGPDGGLAMVYETTEGLTLARCEDQACTLWDKRILREPYGVGDAALAFLADGSLIVIIDLELVRCDDETCEDIPGSVDADLDDGFAYTTASLAIGSDGRPLVAYLIDTRRGLRQRVASCADDECSQWRQQANAPLPSDAAVRQIDMVVREDGRPIILTAVSGIRPAIVVVDCRDTLCSEGDKAEIPIEDLSAIDLELTPDHELLIGFTTYDSVGVARCHDTNCRSITTTVLERPAYASTSGIDLTAAVPGPFLVYWDDEEEALGTPEEGRLEAVFPGAMIDPDVP
jgi:hypothetical protein